MTVCRLVPEEQVGWVVTFTLRVGPLDPVVPVPVVPVPVVPVPVVVLVPPIVAVACPPALLDAEAEAEAEADAETDGVGRATPPPLEPQAARPNVAAAAAVRTSSFRGDVLHEVMVVILALKALVGKALSQTGQCPSYLRTP
jgi:hypothetical protein